MNIALALAGVAALVLVGFIVYRLKKAGAAKDAAVDGLTREVDRHVDEAKTTARSEEDRVVTVAAETRDATKAETRADRTGAANKLLAELRAKRGRP